MSEVFRRSLETERLSLTPLRMSDAEFVLAHFGDPDVNRYLVDVEPVANLQEARDVILWAMGSTCADHNRWGIALRDCPGLIGTCGFHRWDRINRRAEIGYDLDADCWRKGIGLEVVSCLVEFGFSHLALNRLEAFVHVDNVASSSLLRKKGFVREGVIRQKHFFHGAYHDHYIYSLLRSDLECSGVQ